MKNKLKSVLLIGAAVGFSATLSANQMTFFSPDASTGYVGLSADGTSLTSFSAGSWTFQVGTFTPGFDVAGSDFSTWESEWSSAASAQWLVSPPFLAGKFSSQFPLTVEQEAVFTGQQGYIWGFNQTNDLATAEWVLVTNNSWVFPANDPLSTAPSAENTWNFATPENLFIVGNQLDNGFQMQAIPEPSTYALIFGLGILGFLGYRRVRK